MTTSRLWIGMAIALLAALCLGLGDAAAETPLAEYQAVLREALVDLEGADWEAAGRIADRLQAIEPVRLPDGQVIDPDLSPVVRSLETSPPQVFAARERLRALLAEIDRTARPAAPPAVSRAALQQVLARPEFGDGRPTDPVGRWMYDTRQEIRDRIDDLSEAIGDWLDTLTREVPGESPVGGLLRGFRGLFQEWTSRPVRAVAGLVLIAAIVTFVGWSLRRTWGRRLIALPADPRPVATTATGIRGEATRLAQAGHYREAVRLLYLALLLRWDETGRLRFDRTLTNREVLVRAGGRDSATLAERLRPLVERFERVWYAGVPCSATDYAEFDRLVARAWEAP